MAPAETLQRRGSGAGGWELGCWASAVYGEEPGGSLHGGNRLPKGRSVTGQSPSSVPCWGENSSREEQGDAGHRASARHWAVCEKERLECGSMGKCTPQRARRGVPVTGMRFLVCCQTRRETETAALCVWSHVDSACVYVVTCRFCLCGCGHT